MSNTPKRPKGQKPRLSTPPKTATPSPWPKRLLLAGGIAIVALLGAVVLFGGSNIIRGVPEGTETVAVGPPQHVEGDIHAEGEVPAGGPHDAVWANCGFYSTPIRSENAVHSLEHGAVWITYQPTLAPDQIDRIRGLTGRTRKVLVSPVPGQAVPIMATAWGQQLQLHAATDPRLEQFTNEFQGSFDAPEPGGLCTGGVGTPAF